MLNYIKTIVSTARGITAEVIVDYDKKVEIMETPRALVYATTDDEAKIKSETFQKMTGGIEVRIGKMVKEKFLKDRKRNFEDHAAEDELIEEEKYEVKAYSTDE